ncbi:MAG TPA: acyl-CoA dehydrogenase family protein [Mycobacteriales bacterium]|nr:acyl-CoA dehydrogenase family protein [Mycobacteriales bacterium]
MELSPAQRDLQQELRTYFERLLTPDVRRELGGEGDNPELFRALVRQLGTDGWLGLGWPTEYGGGGATPYEQLILFTEVQRAGAPFPFVTVNTVGPTIMAFGSPEQKARYLPPILAGEDVWAIGYTEPGSGTDLASLTTRAVQDGDEWVVDGNKVYTSGAGHSDYVWLAVRTDPDVPKHKGISILCVPTSSPGFSWTPLHTVGGNTTSTTYYDGVRVPLDNVVGEVNGGWRLLTSQLNHERVGLAAMSGRTEGLWDAVFDWARASGVAESPWAQLDLARTYAQVQAMKLVNWDLAGAVAREDVNVANASAAKVFGTETHAAVCRTLFDLLGAEGARRLGSAGAPLEGRVDVLTRGAIVNTFGGGVNEVLRDLICTSELGMPRGSR